MAVEEAVHQSGLDCSTIRIIANRAAKVKKHQE
jgi:hypothetical protein